MFLHFSNKDPFTKISILTSVNQKIKKNKIFLIFLKFMLKHTKNLFEFSKVYAKTHLKSF